MKQFGVKSDPTVTVLIPVYNQAQYLHESIDSVLRQTWTDLELLVVNDGSTDRTPAVMAEFGSRIRALHKANGGTASALNLGIRNARGKWLAWLSADDIWEPTKIALQLGKAQHEPTAALVYTDFKIVDGAGKELDRFVAPAPRTRIARLIKLIRENYINGSTVIVRKDVFDKVGLFDETNRHSQDFDLWLRIATRYDIVHVPEPLVRYRIHTGQGSVDVSAMQRSHDSVVARRSREMPRLERIVCTVAYLVELVDRIPFQVKKASGSRGVPLYKILKNNVRFLILLINRPGERPL